MHTKDQRKTSSQSLNESISKRFPARAPELEEYFDTSTQGTEDYTTNLKDSRIEDDRCEESKNSIRSKAIKDLEIKVVLGGGKYSPHKKWRDEFTLNLAMYEEHGRQEYTEKVGFDQIT